MTPIPVSLLLPFLLTLVSCDKQEKPFDFPLFLNKTYKFVERLSTEGVQYSTDFWRKLFNSSNRECARDVGDLFWNFLKQEEWALQMLDSWAKLANGRTLTAGNTLQLGSPEICKKSSPPSYSTNFCTQKTFLPFDEISFALFDLCLPDTCNENDLNDLFLSVKEFWDIFGITVRNTYICEETKNNQSFDFVFKSVFTLCLFFFGLVIIATIYHFYLLRDRRSTCSLNTTNGYMLSEYEIKSTMRTIKKLQRGSKKMIYQQLEDTKVKSKRICNGYHQNDDTRASQWLLCFSAIRNGRKIFNLNNHGQLECLNGIRALSFKVVLIGHIFLIFPINADNVGQFLTYSQTHPFWYPLFFNFTYSVDSFFVISGLLVSYLYLKLVSNGRNITWFHYYLERFIRLSPAYYFCIIVFEGIFLKLRRNEYHILFDGLLTNCVGSMWSNFFYVSNIFKEACMSYSWYLSCDMQFFLLSPIILTAMVRSRIQGSLVLMGFLSASSSISFYIAYSRGFDLVLYREVTVFVQQWTSQMFDFYTQPYCRIGPYLIGMACGWILFLKKCEFHLNKLQRYLMLMLTMFCLYLSIWSSYHFKTDLFSSSICLFLLRDLWALGLALLIFLCCTGNAGIINSLLSWSPWTVLSRLSYCTYLAHFMIVHYLTAIITKNLHFQITYGVLFFMSYIPIMYLGGLILHLSIEAPANNIKKLLYTKPSIAMNKREKRR